MDQYYLNEHLILFLNDNKISGNKFNKCDYTVNYDKPIILNKLMECALLKLHCPENLFTLPSGDVGFTMELNLWFRKPTQIYYPNINNAQKDINCYNKIYEYNVTTNKDDAIEQLKELEKKMNIQIKKFYNIRHSDPIEVNANEISWTDKIKIFKPGSPRTDLLYEADLLYVPLRILNDDNKLIFEPARFYLAVPYIQDENYLLGLGYLSLTKPLHLHFGIDEEKFPVIELIPEGYDIFFDQGALIPTIREFYKNKFGNRVEIKPTDLNLRQTKHQLLNEQIYLYCDIVKESYVDTQKVNILQTFLSETKVSDNDIRSIEFKNLIYIPLRIDEITSISIQLRDRTGASIYNNKGAITCVLKIRPIEHI